MFAAVSWSPSRDEREEVIEEVLVKSPWMQGGAEVASGEQEGAFYSFVGQRLAEKCLQKLLLVQGGVDVGQRPAGKYMQKLLPVQGGVDVSSLGRWLFEGENSYNKPPPLPGLAC